MMFNVESDTGDRITGYLVPDSFAGQSTLVVSDGQREVLRIKTTEPREALVAGRRHESGLCGFTLDTTMLPDIASMKDVRLTDAESGLLVYCRRSTPSIPMRVFRLETHLFPLWELDNQIGKYFRYTYKGLERWGRESVEQIFHLNDADSFYVSGRLFFRHFEHIIDQKKIKMIVMVRNPHYEMAERLLVLHQLGQTNNQMIEGLFGQRDTLVYEEAIEFAKALDLKDAKSLRRELRYIPDSVAVLLSNPLVRLLAAQTQDETLYAGSISSSLDALASCAVVGMRDQADLFLAALARLLEIQDFPTARLADSNSIVYLGEMLATINTATDLIDRDLELYSYLTKAFQNSLDIEETASNQASAEN